MQLKKEEDGHKNGKFFPKGTKRFDKKSATKLIDLASITMSRYKTEKLV